MKILDRYILTTYLKTFISVFSILILIFALQTIWLYIRELAGKDLDISVIFKFLLYFLPKLIPLVLPLTILLASIMVFGSFAENYEFAAMKSTGISLQRAMSGLSIFIVILGFTTFLFANNVIPWAEFNSFNLRKNIAKLKPAMAIAKGQFNEIDTYNIKVQNKTGDRGQYLEDVTIHIKGPDGRTNTTTIKSKTGELVSSEKSDVLKLVLKDGNYYNDLQPKNPQEKKKKPFAKSNFEQYTINIDLSKMNDVDIDDKSLTDKYNMLNISGLNYTIDSLAKKRESEHKVFSRSLYQRANILGVTKATTTNIKIKRQNKRADAKKPTDSVYTGNILDLYDTKKKNQIVTNSLASISSVQQLVSSEKYSLKPEVISFNRHIISLHEKLALGFACIILFFVGAPLGALIRKGGIGLPMVIAILIFLTYHFIGIFATNSGKSGGLNPILAPWVSTLIMLPLGIYLTKRATADRGLFETDGILEYLKKLLGIKKKAIEEDTSIFQKTTEEYKNLLAFENNKLIDTVKNYRQYGYPIKYKNTALSILNSRGISNMQLKFTGNFSNQPFEEAIRLKNKFEEDSKLAFILYIISTVLIVVGRVLENNGFPLLGNILFIIGLVVEITYTFALIKSFISNSNFYKHIGKESTYNAILFFIVGLPLYVLLYVFYKNKMEEDLYVNNDSKLKRRAFQNARRTI